MTEGGVCFIAQSVICHRQMLYSLRMNIFKRIFAIAIIAVLVGQGCTKGPTQEAKKLAEPVTLTIWSAIDDDDAYDQMMRNFRQSYPYASLVFKRYRLEEYEDQLLNALAEDRGPDIFMIHNTWVGKYLSKISPQPPKVKVARQVVTGNLKKEVTIEVQEISTISPTKLRNEFVDVVAADTIRKVDVADDPKHPDYQERILGLPMSVDTLALYYNKDLLNAAGIPNPPENWADVQEQVRKLALVSAEGNIIRAGIGMGTGENVERSPDIISLLMMQNGAEMSDDRGYITFNQMPDSLRDTLEQPPAYGALRFYTDFANPGKNVYTWNADQPNSMDAFIRGTSAFFLGYHYQLPTIRANAPKLNLGITSVPQIQGTPEVNYANYWLWTVSTKSDAPDLAWHFINYMTGEDGVKLYQEELPRPTARRSFIAEQLEDPDLGVFASQLLTAKSWYRGSDPEAMESAMMDLIETVPADDRALRDSLKIAVEKVNQTVTDPLR